MNCPSSSLSSSLSFCVGRQVLSNGVKAVFLRSFEASAQRLHLSRPGRKHKIGDTLQARIVFVDYTNKDIGLSSALHVLRLAQPRALDMQFGDFCYDSRVTEVQRRNGLFTHVYPSRTETTYPKATMTVTDARESDAAQFAVDRAAEAAGDNDSGDSDDDDNHRNGAAATGARSSRRSQQRLDDPIGHVHISALADKRVRVLKQGKFRVGQVVTRARVVGHRAMDNMVLLSTQPSVLTEAVLTYEDVATGAALKGEVSNVTDKGVVVKLSRNVHGFVPRMHISDVAGRHADPHKKFKAGQKVKCRVLTCDPVARKVQLTFKNTLVRSKLDILSTYNDATAGTSAHGFVSALNERKGITVTFYGGCYGVIPATDLAEVGVDDCTTAYEVGQVIACRVVACKGRRLRLALDSLGDAALEQAETQRKARRAAITSQRALAPDEGTVVSGTILEEGSTDANLMVAINVPATAATPATDADGGVEQVLGVLPKEHVRYSEFFRFWYVVVVVAVLCVCVCTCVHVCVCACVRACVCVV